MYITILDYSRASVSFIHDTEDVTKNLLNESVEDILSTLGFKDSDICYMVTEQNPCAEISSVTLRELIAEVDEDIVEELQQRLKYWNDGE